MNTLTLDTPIQYVPRVGPAMAKKLERLGIFQVSDLLFYPPFRYNDFSQIVSIGKLKPETTVTIRGSVMSIKSVITKNGKRLVQSLVADPTGSITITWYNQTYLTRVILPGQTIQLSGKVSWYGHSLTLESPEYEIISDTSSGRSLHTGRLVPVYSETAGLSSKWLRGRVDFLLTSILHNMVDLLPGTIRGKYKLGDIQTSLSQLHFPNSFYQALFSRKYLAFQELFIFNLLSLKERRLWQTTQSASKYVPHPKFWQQFLNSLPFKLTNDQQNVISQIKNDLEKPVPMNRLLEGDVGAGKTVVAAAAACIVAQNGDQVAVMAPTEILASQHYDSLRQFLKPLGIAVTLVTGSKKLNSQEKLSVLVGTHALLSDKIKLPKLGLVIVDEQQRFGAAQRLTLRQKGNTKITPHLLTMTATPIPRTIARTMYGNLDLSVIENLPEGRKQIKTWVVPNEKRGKAYDWIKNILQKDQSQAFVVCPLIDESENLESVKAVKSEFERLRKKIFPQLKLGLLHGRMKSKEKTVILEEFRAKKYDILVTTPVVEVGIDIPDATIMLIEGAERFGLSQLHQLRGRVGRRENQAYCLLFTELTGERIITRLKHLESTFSGPRLAEIDLSLRGPGDLFGNRQHGIPGLKFASLADTNLISEVQEAADWLMRQDPGLNHYPDLKQIIEKSKIDEISKD